MGTYRTGRHNFEELIYWQAGDEPDKLDPLRMVIVSGPEAARVANALNTEQAKRILEAETE